jgi:hypothetical protein
MDEYCDRCGAAGKVHVVLPSGNDLVFCAHHGREYEEKLTELEALFIDEKEDELERV